MSRLIHSDSVDGGSTDFRLTIRLLKFVLPHLPLLAIGFLSMLLSTFCSLIQPYLIKLVIDKNLVAGTLNGFTRYVILFFLAVSGGMLFGYLQMIAVQTLGQRVILKIREKVFNQVMMLPLYYFDGTPSGRVITRITSDVEALNEMISAGIVSVIGDLLLIMAITLILILLDVHLFLVTLIVIIFLLIFVQAMKVRVRGVNRDMRGHTASLNSFLQEYISGIAVVKSFTREAGVRDMFDRKNSAYREEGERLSTLYSLYFPGIGLLSSMAVILILWRGGAGVYSGAVTLGSVIAFNGYLEKFFGPLRDMSDKYAILQSALASCERIFSLIDMHPSPEYSLPDNGGRVEVIKEMEEGHTSPVIEMRNISFDYGGEDVLKDFSLTLERGESVAIVGPTGAGKSTIVNLLLRFYDIQKGEILYRGIDIGSLSAEKLREQVILVPQEPYLFNGTVLDNILAGRPYEKNRLEVALRGCGILSFIQRFPEGLSTHVGERGSSLSAGERQLVSYARALYRAPEVLILDEATSSVDPETEHELLSAMGVLMEGKASIVIAHRFQTVVKCDRIAVLLHGRVVEEGSHKELMEMGEVYSKLYNIQAIS